MNRHLSRLPACPACKGTDTRKAEWVGEPAWVCIDCALCGAGADAYFDTPAPTPCSECNGTGIKSEGYVADDGDTYRECPACRS